MRMRANVRGHVRITVCVCVYVYLFVYLRARSRALARVFSYYQQIPIRLEILRNGVYTVLYFHFAFFQN